MKRLKSWISYNDVSAGLLVALVGLPQCLAYAILAGLPPTYGLATALIPGVVAAFIGRSISVVTGPTNTTGLIVLATLSPFLSESGFLRPEHLGILATLTLMAGLLRLLLSGLNIVQIFRFVPESVLVGFGLSAGVLIAAMQLDEILGLTIARANNLWQELYHLYQALASGQSLDLFSTFLGLFFLSILVLVKRRYHRWPVALVGLVGITSLSLIFSWHERFSLRRLGDVAIVKAGWPQGAWPQWDYDLIVSLIVPALAIALLGSLELIVTLRAGNEEDIDLGHEIKAQGWANVVGALTSSFPASASLTRSGLLRLENAHSKNAAIIGALAMIPILFFGASFVSAIPLAVIAAVLMAGIFGLFPWKKIFRMCTLSRKTAFLLTSTFIMGVTLPFHWAVLLGVVFSLLIFLYDVQTPEILLFVPDANNVLVPYVRSQQATGIADFAGQNHMGRGSAVVVRWSGSLFFAAAHHLYQTLPHRLPQGVETVYLDLSYTHHFRYTALDALEKLNILLRGRGQTLILVGIDEAMATKFQKVATPLRWFPGPVSREIFLHTLA